MKTQKKSDEMVRTFPASKTPARELMTEAEFKEFCRKRRERMNSAA